ncbi:HAD-IIA family hydrolase [Candidatus Micrarchaeota archaeon]|nr:HAD-IIA family hydrolase [Candidatus Micrarchaeota archaeon]MBU1166338.1 HAD-IIA family hydrolase [Candidatus Micrarchaeota archaeon]MBU1886410.1 HAD-IIA family hydrolase [Candidatus Micrarchaeota archaeon]
MKIELQHIKAVVFDLDGTLFVGKTPIDGAKEKLEELRRKGKQIIFLTNAGTRSRKGVAEKLNAMGFEANEKEVYTSSYLLAKYVTTKYKKKKVFVVGEQGIIDELKLVGVEFSEEDADIVVGGLDRKFTYEKLAKALILLDGGAELIGTNGDSTYPTEHGLMPGAGSVIAAIECASGKKAHLIGKPNICAIEIIEKEHGVNRNEILVVGDRLNTDIKFAKACEVKSALVLTGVSRKKDIKEIKPDYILKSIVELCVS